MKLDTNNPEVLELYGTILGDGWLGKYKNKKKGREYFYYLLGISGNSKLDREYFDFLAKKIKKLFGVTSSIRKKKLENTIELRVCNENLVKSLNSTLQIPLGKKGNFKIKKDLAKDWEKMRHIIRGIFDTDGSLYFDKTPVGNPYPIISIFLTANDALKQIRDSLLNNGFKVQNRKDRPEIKIKGLKQIKKWMDKIGCNNQRHLLKYNKIKGL